jgi:broad specificity phosphatase PhoE
MARDAGAGDVERYSGGVSILVHTAQETDVAFVTKGSDIGVLLAAIHGEDVMQSSPPKMLLMRRTAAAAAD